MEQDEFSEFLITKRSENVKSYSKLNANKVNFDNNVPLNTKKAVELLLQGTLKSKVCRYCLRICTLLYEMDQLFYIGGQVASYKVTVQDMIASIHPFKVIDDPNFPNKICNKCLNTMISSYLFSQQCERAGRALRNCFDDMYEKLDKLDPLEKVKRRGRQKLNPNHNILYTEHHKVIDYADPIINIINRGSETIEESNTKINELECPKCWEILPNVESLVNHEKIHPKTMWFHCRLCGQSYPKRSHYKKHVKTSHFKCKEMITKTDFECTDCGVISEVYDKHLQHIEKHKFQTVLEHLVESKMDKLCVVCMNKGFKMIDLEKTINLHGGCPELTGQRNIYNILGSTIPEMNPLYTYTGTKVCDVCLDHALTSYIFVNQAHYIRNRLNTCVNLMLDNLNKIGEPEGKVFIEISQDMILPAKEADFDESLIDDECDETKLKVDVLEDEFRIKSDSELSDAETKIKDLDSPLADSLDHIENPAKNAKRTYTKRKLVNGLQSCPEKTFKELNNVCSEFLTFKKKRKPVKSNFNCKYTCHLCSKHFITEYFLRRHILKHAPMRMECKICKRHFKSKFYLYEHMRMVHLLRKTSFCSCNHCGRSFVSYSKLMKHSKSHKNKECQLCNKLFLTQQHHDNHMQRHVYNLKAYKDRQIQTCSFCEKACSNDNNLSVHVNKVHLQIKPYSCDMCEKQFYTESNMNAHKRVHSMFVKEICTFCNKTLKSRKDLVIHVRKHIDVKPYSCQVCSMAFYSQTKLKSHMKVYHGGEFCCKLCKHVFINKSKLKDHINRVHNII